MWCGKAALWFVGFSLGPDDSPTTPTLKPKYQESLANNDDYKHHMISTSKPSGFAISAKTESS